MTSLENALNAVKQYDPDALMRLYHGARKLSLQADAIYDTDFLARRPGADRFKVIAKNHGDEADCYLRAYAVLQGVTPIDVESIMTFNINMRFLFTEDDFMWIRLKWA